MLARALDYPSSGDRSGTAVLVGGVFVFFNAASKLVGVSLLLAWADDTVAVPALAGAAVLAGLALLTGIPLRGYRIRVLRSAVSGEDAPGFDDVPQLVRDGGKGLVIYAVYLLPVFALGGAAASGTTSVQTGTLGTLTRDVLRQLAGLSLLFGLLYFIGMSYLLPGAMTRFAQEERLKSAFEFRNVADVAVSEDYAVGWVLSVFLQFVATPILWFLWFFLVGALVQFYVAVATRYIWGTSYGRAAGNLSRDEAAGESEETGSAGDSLEPALGEETPPERHTTASDDRGDVASAGSWNRGTAEEQNGPDDRPPPATDSPDEDPMSDGR